MKKQEEMNKRFDEKFPCNHHSAQCGGDCKNDIKSFLQSEIDLAVAEERKRVVEKIKEWKNEGDNPTETDLVLENILSLINKEDDPR